MPTPVGEALAEMSRRIQDIEARRMLKNRSERSRLAAESQPIQDAIDKRCGLCDPTVARDVVIRSLISLVHDS